MLPSTPHYTSFVCFLLYVLSLCTSFHFSLYASYFILVGDSILRRRLILCVFKERKKKEEEGRRAREKKIKRRRWRRS